MVYKMCEGISCSPFSVKELDVIVHKKYFPCITLLNLAILYPTSLANLVVEMGTRQSHQILLICCYILPWASCSKYIFHTSVTNVEVLNPLTLLWLKSGYHGDASCRVSTMSEPFRVRWIHSPSLVAIFQWGVWHGLPLAGVADCTFARYKYKTDTGTPINPRPP